MYDLIIKPTQLCNFRCSFCSSSDIAQDNETLSLNTLFNFLKNNDIGRIIINGGDPLMMPPEYYTSILNFLDKNGMSTRLSFTTNLWDYYNNPSKWEKIFKEDREEYISALRLSQEEETNLPFLDFMAGQLKKSLSLEIERFNVSRKKGFSFMF